MDKDKKLIFEALENPEVLERSVSRRGALGLSGKFGAGVALATMPVMLAALTRRAFAQGALPNEIVNPLNFALVLEYLESDFYTMGLESDGLIPDEDRAIFEQLSKHETAHVAFLSSVLGSAAAIRPQWDFTAKGAFDPFNDYPTFTLLSQGFEDAGVRAYKGQAGNVASNDDILTAALRIHSVEARHASEVRRLRGEKGWVTLVQPNTPAALAAVYAGEENTTHLGIDVSGYQGADAAAEAFDEPLGLEEVLAIAGLFGTGT
ncbi:MAG: ferritin-like domain-containing protein [Gemmatimonadota bacterium]|nr:ferritin-like domain-containing protein [Gemmatimonadota bacterium]